MEILRPLDKTTYPSYTVSYSDTAGNTPAWQPGPQGVVVWSTTASYIEVGEGAVATTASTPIPAFTPIPFYAPQTGGGAPWRVSALRVADNGVVYCKPINIR
jgi:hypothetical protein